VEGKGHNVFSVTVSTFLAAVTDENHGSSQSGFRVFALRLYLELTDKSGILLIVTTKVTDRIQ